MELEGLVMEAEFDRLQRYSDRSFLAHAKQDTNSYLDQTVFKDCMEREAVKKDLLQSSVRSSVHVAEVFKIQEKTCIVHRLGLTHELALDLRTRWDVNDPSQRAKVWSVLQREKPILIVGSSSGLGTKTTHMRWMIDVYRWQVAQGRFFVHGQRGSLPVSAELCAMKSVFLSRVDQWNFFSRVVKKYTTISPTQMFISWRELCPGGTWIEASVDSDWLSAGACVYYDDVTGASLPFKLCEEAMQVEIQYMRETNVFLPCEYETVKKQGLAQVLSSRLTRGAGDEDDNDGPNGHIHAVRGDSSC